MSYLDPFRLRYRSKLGHEVCKNVSKRQVKLPTGDNNQRDWKEVWRTGNLIFEIRGHMIYLVGGYSSYDSKSGKWHPTKNPHFYGLGEEDGPLIGHLIDLSPIECVG